MQKGIFITFEGNDGSGKTTVATLVYEALLQKAYPVVYTREPGGIDIAEQIREVILNPENIAMDARCEALLYAASRRQHLIEKVIPALQAYKIVLCDRFLDSSLAYQGIARDLGIEEVLRINQFVIEGYMPDATIFLSVDLDTGLARIKNRGKLDRMDSESIQFHKKVAQGYDIVRNMFKERMHVIDANLELETVVENTLREIQKIIASHD